MKIPMEKLVLLFLWIALFEACTATSVTYDYSANIECLKKPPKPLYGGGIIEDEPSSEFTVVKSKSKSELARSPIHKVELKKDTHYALSAWLQLSKGSGDVKAVFAPKNGPFVIAGVIVTKSGCWSMLKGGMTSSSSGPADLFFETVNKTDAEVLVDSVSLQPFTFAEWSGHRNSSIHKNRKKTVKLVAQDANGKPLSNAKLSLERVGKGFPVGNAMTKEILDIPEYEEWFTSRFTVATFENEMKWYSTEYRQDEEDYRIPDKMLELAQKYNISVRGHNVFWDDQNNQMKWVTGLSVDKLKNAMAKRLKNVVSRYAGKLIAWDVVNENLHFRFFEEKLGKDASPQIYKQVAELDSKPLLFMNEFNTIEQPGDFPSIPTKYLEKLEQIRSYPGNKDLKLAIGLESHFATPNIPYMRASLDMFAQAGVPIWLTEVDVTKSPKQVEYLEEVMREGFAHPAVDGIVLWAAWHAKGCYVMCLTDNKFKNLPVGDVIDKLIDEWKDTPKDAKTGKDGEYEAEIFYGEYNVTISHSSLKKPIVQKATIDENTKGELTIKPKGS